MTYFRTLQIHVEFDLTIDIKRYRTRNMVTNHQIPSEQVTVLPSPPIPLPYPWKRIP